MELTIHSNASNSVLSEVLLDIVRLLVVQLASGGNYEGGPTATSMMSVSSPFLVSSALRMEGMVPPSNLTSTTRVRVVVSR